MKRAALLKIVPSPVPKDKENKQKTILQLWCKSKSESKLSTKPTPPLKKVSKNCGEIVEVILDDDSEDDDNLLLQNCSSQPQQARSVLSDISVQNNQNFAQSESYIDEDDLLLQNFSTDLATVSCSKTDQSRNQIINKSADTSGDQDFNDLELLKASETFDTLQNQTSDVNNLATANNNQAESLTCGIEEEDVS